MSGHTPGPWRLAKEPPACGLTVTLYGFGPKTLGTINTGNYEYCANARLIAAAPEMLEALRQIIRYCDGNPDADPVISRTAERAIDKATAAPLLGAKPSGLISS